MAPDHECVVPTQVRWCARCIVPVHVRLRWHDWPIAHGIVRGIIVHVPDIDPIL
jgi:hypothetical protein